MFGMGIGEIVVIIVVALLFIGPEKLPEAAKSLSKGIRDIRKQTRELRDTIDEDTEFGGAIRDLQSALRGEDHEAAERARRRIAAQKSATLKSGTASGTSAAELAAGAAPLAPQTPASNVDTAGTNPSPAPTAAGAPVIAASAGAIARGAATAPTPGATSPESTGTSTGEPEVPQPAPGHAHG